LKRQSFVASAAGAIFAGLALRAKAEGRIQSASTVANVETPRWPRLPWECASAVVWLDAERGVYYYKGDRSYGRTKHGAYTCENKAIGAGNRARIEG
jgi:hypothetical protein